MSGLDKVYRLKDNVKIRKREKRWDLMEEDGMIVTLNPVATEIVKRFDGEKELGEIIDDIKDMFDVDRQTIADDIQPFIDKVKEFDLLEEVE